MLDLSKVTHLHIELSTHCNARCPQCPRNFNGWNHPIMPANNPKHFDLTKLAALAKQFKNCEILFNGNHGDPMMHPDVVECASLFDNVSIGTNGSIGTLNSYMQLAQQGVEMIFSIDGLADTNHIYRQDVIWRNIMSRAKMFIVSGGYATWKFIIFKHNAHQILEVRKLADKMGFRRFELVSAGRDYGPIMNDKGEIINWLLSANDNREAGEYDIDFNLKIQTDPVERKPKPNFSDRTITCETLKNKSIYFNVDGEVLPCCYHGVHQHIHPIGTTLQEQMNSFKFLENGWETPKCDETCYESCGRK
jgi:MoaA/NifB/PqqE/SkfB family radical SAM enzyme